MSAPRPIEIPDEMGDELIERIRRRVEVDPETGCWRWTGSTRRGGYGQMLITVEGRRRCVRVHRLSYVLHVGPMPRGQILRHTCDRPHCVAPDHLEPGTPADNSRDMVERGRSASGEDHSQHRLTRAQVAVIKWRIGRGDSDAAIAADYSVTSGTIRAIRLGYTWRDVEPAPPERQTSAGGSEAA